MLRYRAQAEREYRRAVEDFDRLKALRHEMPNEPNVGLEQEPEDIVPIEELNWELPHIRLQQEKEANRARPNEPNAPAPNEAKADETHSSQITSADPNEANTAAPNEPKVADFGLPLPLTSPTPSPLPEDIAA